MTEPQIRYRLKTVGAMLRKSRARTITANNHGDYMVVDADTNAVIVGADFNVTLKEIVEHFDLSVRKAR